LIGTCWYRVQRLEYLLPHTHRRRHALRKHSPLPRYLSAPYIVRLRGPQDPGATGRQAQCRAEPAGAADRRQGGRLRGAAYAWPATRCVCLAAGVLGGGIPRTPDL